MQQFDPLKTDFGPKDPPVGMGLDAFTAPIQEAATFDPLGPTSSNQEDDNPFKPAKPAANAWPAAAAPAAAPGGGDMFDFNALPVTGAGAAPTASDPFAWDKATPGPTAVAPPSDGFGGDDFFGGALFTKPAAAPVPKPGTPDWWSTTPAGSSAPAAAGTTVPPPGSQPPTGLIDLGSPVARPPTKKAPKAKGKRKKKKAEASSSDESDEEKSSSEESSSSVKVVAKKKGKSKKSNKKSSDKKKSGKSPDGYDALSEMKRGTALLKYGRRGYPHFRQFQLSVDGTRIEWFSKRKRQSETTIPIKDIKTVYEGQKTEVFKRVEWPALKPASFSVIYGRSNKSLDVVAKSVDEAKMWIEAIRQLKLKYDRREDLSKIATLMVKVDFRDRNRPKSRDRSGKFKRGSDKDTKMQIDPQVKKRLEEELTTLKTKFRKLAFEANVPSITKSIEYKSVSRIMSELEERLEELEDEVINTRDTKITENDVWRTKVDIETLLEKVVVLKQRSR